MNNKNYRCCTRCVMDNSSDPTISFDNHGYCNYCTNALNAASYAYFPNREGTRKLEKLIYEIKESGKGKKYDCLMGISGGLDSSYLAFLGAKWGLRILAVHIDDGFDAPVATDNINKLCKKANLDLHIIKPDANQYNDLIRSYFLAGVPNIAVPQDNILLAEIHTLIKRNGIKFFLSGTNFSLECILQRGNSYTTLDVKNIQAIHKKFGTLPLSKLRFISERKRFLDRFIYGIRTVTPLNYIDYNKERAIKELKDFCDFNYYEAKHLENLLTKVIQLYWFYHKFHVDKRRSHFSSLIVSGQLTRESALAELEKPVYDPDQIEKDITFILEKIKLSRSEFHQLVYSPGVSHENYSHSKNILLKWMRNIELINKMKTKL